MKQFFSCDFFPLMPFENGIIKQSQNKATQSHYQEGHRPRFTLGQGDRAGRWWKQGSIENREQQNSA